MIANFDEIAKPTWPTYHYSIYKYSADQEIARYVTGNHDIADVVMIVKNAFVRFPNVLIIKLREHQYPRHALLERYQTPIFFSAKDSDNFIREAIRKKFFWGELIHYAY